MNEFGGAWDQAEMSVSDRLKDTPSYEDLRYKLWEEFWVGDGGWDVGGRLAMMAWLREHERAHRAELAARSRSSVAPL